MLASTTGEGAKVQLSPSSQASTLTQIQRDARGIAVLSSRYCAMGMDSNSTAPRIAASSHASGDSQSMPGIEPENSSSPMIQASAAATPVTTGHRRTMPRDSCRRDRAMA